ncbi:EamA family transporter [Lapillicoccus jejuensis]|uniref:O-acetylserine/cysteine efflux transporter n=1 Tax=Lapillicoccus jejuensis TaxID=402171 RepID=A0A542DZ99_9MICO|nr:EamA family transporter [Lapillicoccus jejuensis]TQJ08423.1 O-acetylserine/cysteine efflux transporter [Lapillicoccus jejuensis]
MAPRHVGLALLVVLIWGVNFVVIHEGLPGMPPLLFAAIRFAAVCLALPFVKRPAIRWRDLAAVGLLMSAGQFGFLYSALAAGLASGLASLVLQAQALFTVVIAALVLREKPRPVQVGGLVVALVGLVVVALGRSGATPLTGLLLCLGAAACWGAGNVAARRCAGASGLGLTVWGSVFVPVPLLALSLLLDGPAAIGTALTHVGLAAVLSTAYTVVLASLVGYTIWNGLLGRYPAASVAPFTLLVPVVGLFAGWLVLDERPVAASFVGGALLLVGVAVVVVGPRVLAARTARREKRERPIPVTGTVGG